MRRFALAALLLAWLTAPAVGHAARPPPTSSGRWPTWPAPTPSGGRRRSPCWGRPATRSGSRSSARYATAACTRARRAGQLEVRRRRQQVDARRQGRDRDQDGLRRHRAGHGAGGRPRGGRAPTGGCASPSSRSWMPTRRVASSPIPIPTCAAERPSSSATRPTRRAAPTLEAALATEKDPWVRHALAEALAADPAGSRRRRGARGGGHHAGRAAFAQRGAGAQAAGGGRRRLGGRAPGGGRGHQEDRAVDAPDDHAGDGLPGRFARLDPAAHGAGAGHRVRADGRHQHGARRAHGAGRLHDLRRAELVPGARGRRPSTPTSWWRCRCRSWWRRRRAWCSSAG